MKTAVLKFKNGTSKWNWRYLRNGRVLVSKDFYDNEGYYRADASYNEEMSRDNLNRSIEMAQQLLNVTLY